VTLDDVKRALEFPRPGREAHLKLSPRPRPGDVYPLPREIRAKDASVLILLFPKDTSLEFFLTQRTDKVETHKGQISLPGGMQEPGEKLWETALREAAEELRINPDGVQVFHRPLTQVYIPVSGFRVTPYVGFAQTQPPVQASADEVLEVIETPLEILVDKKYLREEEWEMRNFKAMVPYYCFDGYKIWGATAMILSEFGEMLKQVKASV